MGDVVQVQILFQLADSHRVEVWGCSSGTCRHAADGSYLKIAGEMFQQCIVQVM